MKPEEWPIAAPAADRPVDPARLAGSDRLATVRRDFSLDPAERLSEQERALMSAIIDDLVASLADRIIAALPDGLDAIGGAGHDALLVRLGRSGLLDRPVLIALLLRRADEQRLANVNRPHSHRVPLIQRWVSDSDGEIAAGAMALAIARGRRRDRYGQGRLLFDDLPAEEAVALAYLIAAGLRAPLPPHPGIDRALAAATAQLLATHDEGERMDALLSGHVRLLERAGRLDDVLVEEVAADGEMALLAAILARRGAIPDTFAWNHLVGGGGGRLVLLARLANLSRRTTARLVADLAEAVGITDPAAEMAAFDRLGAEAVEDARGEWRLPSDYRSAREVLRG